MKKRVTETLSLPCSSKKKERWLSSLPKRAKVYTVKVTTLLGVKSFLEARYWIDS